MLPCMPDPLSNLFTPRRLCKRTTRIIAQEDRELKCIPRFNLGMIPLIVTPSVEAGFQRSCVLPLPLRVRFIKPLNRFEDCLSSQRSEERKQMNRRGNQKRFPSRRFMNQRTPSPATMPTGAVGRGSKSGLTIIRYLKTSTLKKKKGT